MPPDPQAQSDPPTEHADEAPGRTAGRLDSEESPVEPEEFAFEQDGSAGQPDSHRSRRRRGVFRRLADRAKAVGERVVHSAIDRIVGAPKPDAAAAAQPGDPSAAPEAAESPAEARRRLGLLHGVTLRLRGAADEYIAAKLDEIEARVDVKLDEVEKRIDQKIVELHEQVRKLRDDELRHRLRILKITLIFTVLVAALSLLYKLVVRAMSG